MFASWEEKGTGSIAEGTFVETQVKDKPPQLLFLLNFPLSWCLLHSIAFVWAWYLGNFGEGWKVGGDTLEAGQQ